MVMKQHTAFIPSNNPSTGCWPVPSHRCAAEHTYSVCVLQMEHGLDRPPVGASSPCLNLTGEVRVAYLIR